MFGYRPRRTVVKPLHPLLCTCCLLLVSLTAAAEVYRQLPLEQLRQLAWQGDVQAQIELGQALQYGEGVARDPGSAVVWYCRAAAKGSVRAAYELGWFYANGPADERNDAFAGHWLRVAAAAGDELAARLLRRLSLPVGTDRNGCESVATLPWLEQRCGDPACRRIVALVERLSRHSGIDANLILAVIDAESGFDPRARSGKGARGLMQLLPATAKRFGVTDIWDPEQNIRGGIAYLQWLLARFDGDLALALAGYNAGEHRVLQYGGVPPYVETRAYVERILRDYGRRHHPVGAGWLDSTAPAGATVVDRREPRGVAAES